MVNVGKLQIGMTDDTLKEFTRRRCEKLKLKMPKIYNCKTFAKTTEEGDIVEFSSAHLTIDQDSPKSICRLHFWPGRAYARPWVFTDKEPYASYT